MPARPLRLSSARLPGGPRATLPALPEVERRRSLQRVMWHVRELPPSLIEGLWDNPDAVVAAAHMLKDGDRCTVVRIEAAPVDHPTGDEITSDAGESDEGLGEGEGKGEREREVGGEHASLTLKRYNLKSTLHTAIHMPLRSRARWSWLNGRKLLKAGVPTPQPLACVEERRHGVLHLRSYLLTEFVPGRSLLDLVHSRTLSHEQLADLAKQFTRIWQSLGQLRAGHGDMKATNFIVDPHGKLWLIDLDGLRIHHSATLLRRERRNDLTRFMRNWQERPEVAAIFRARIGTG
jgi:hypothetical protein